MHKLPHTYFAAAKGGSIGNLTIYATKLPSIECAPPHQFGGPGNQWSPEELLLSSVSSCLVLSFRAIAKASQFEWQAIDCVCEGQLEKVGREIKFTAVNSKVTLTIDASQDAEKAEMLLQKAEQTCFISNSLACDYHLETTIVNG